MHMYLIELQMMSGKMSRSRSSQKVEGQIHRSKLTTFKLLHIETFIYGVHVYLMEPHIWSSDVSGSMSSFQVKGQMCMQEKSPILTLGHNFWTRRERGFIFYMHMYFMELQKLSSRMSRSRSSQKVKGQVYRSKQTTFKLLQIETLYVACKCISYSCTC